MNLYDNLVANGVWKVFTPEYHWCHLNEQQRYETWSYFETYYPSPKGPVSYVDFCNLKDNGDVHA